MRILVLTCLTLLAAEAAGATRISCPPAKGIAVQVLGSGGPIADDGRSSVGYLVWIDGESKMLIDAGGGTFLRFGEAGASFADLEFIGLSHFHTDHSADFPALLKSGYFAGRSRPLAVAGPDGDRPFPGLHDFLASMLATENGAYAYLSGYLDGSGRLAKLVPTEVSGEEGVRVFEQDIDGHAVVVDAMHVPHGIVPTLAFRVAIGDFVAVFASDQNGSKAGFIGFSRNADLLVMHMAVPQGASGAATKLHAVPARIGEIAAAAGAGQLVLSHFMARSLRDLAGNIEHVQKNYSGQIVIAEDLTCLAAREAL